jgi:hypothetical protein
MKAGKYFYRSRKSLTPAEDKKQDLSQQQQPAGYWIAFIFINSLALVPICQAPASPKRTFGTDRLFLAREPLVGEIFHV